MPVTFTRRHFMAAGLALCGGAAFPPAFGADAVQVEGQPFARQVAVGGQQLLLNGTGVRAVAWLKGFAAGLYLARRSSEVAQVLAMPGAKRLQLRMLQEAPAAELVKALNKGMQRNTAPAEVPALQARLEQLDEAMQSVGRVKKGDVADFDLDPARGLVFTFNGTPRGQPIDGADFYAALLRSFVGERPYDKVLKAGLLGLPAA